jgi:hypothetical protein
MQAGNFNNRVAGRNVLSYQGKGTQNLKIRETGRYIPWPHATPGLARKYGNM